MTGLTDATRIIAGLLAMYARSTSRGLVAWGADGGGLLGRGVSGTFATTPVDSSALASFIDIDVGLSHGCGYDAMGRVFCWGENPQDMIPGVPNGGSSPTPVQIPLPAP